MTETIANLAEHRDAFGKRFKVAADDIDGFGHVNNAVYLRWIDEVVWAHTRHVGLGEDVCLALNRGMATVRHEIDYLAAAYLDDEVAVFNWVVLNDGRLRAGRLFQIVRIGDGKTLLRAKSDYVCTNLKTGRPARMPEAFVAGYAVTRSPPSEG